MANENINNQNDIKSILTMPLAVVVVSLVVAIYLITTQIIPGVGETANLSDTYRSSKEQYDEITQSIEKLQKQNIAAKQAANNSSGIDKGLFKPLESGIDSESILASEFSEILELMKANAIKTRSVKYNYTPEDDSFYRNAPDKFSVCQLDMQMIANYTNFKNFMKDLYKHEHYLDIANIEIVPYQKNKSILLINLKLKLYAEKI